MKMSARLASRIVLAVFAMAITFVSSEAIADAFASAPYFPLPTGASWNYNVLDETLTLQGTATVTRNSTTTNINEVSTIRLDTSAPAIGVPVNGSRSYYTSDDNGIRLHRRYTPGVIVNNQSRDVTITFSNSPVVLANGTTDVGSTASPTSGTATLEIPGAGLGNTTVTCSLPYTEPQPFTVNGFGSVTVPAGLFDNVLNISGSVRIQGTCSGTAVDQTLTLTLYLAQNIGPVKSITTTTDNLTLVADTSTSELTGTNLPAFTLTVTKTGTGTGTVTSSPTGINCGADCSESYLSSPLVTLTATPTDGSTFGGWGGDCDSSGQVTVNADKTCIATFNPPPATYALSVSKSGSGTGTVTSNPAGINCGGDCSESYGENTLVALTAVAAANSTFVNWSGDCTGSASTCNLTMSSAKTATAAFDLLPTYSLNVTVTGTGSVTSSPSGINCPGTCAGNFGGIVTLTANTSGGSTFTGWTGACMGSATICNLTMDGAKTVSATFTVPPPPTSYSLTVSKGGTGTGTVTSSPGGIDCGSTCTASFNAGNGVVLTATPTGGSTFTGWTGACTGPSTTCNLTMDSAKTVSATFTASLSLYALTVTKGGTGTGTVTSSPGGIDCGSTCTASFNVDNGVVLTATPTGGSTFTGWTGACTGSATTCALAMDSAKTVSATFNLPPPPPPGSYTLTAAQGGTGTGTVTSSPGGIDCGGDCNESYTSGTPVTLTAAPTGGSTFDGWGGACTGTGLTCNLTMNSDQSVSATFTAPPPPSPLVRTFLTTDTITAEHTYYDPNDACLGVPPASLKFFAFTLEGQLALGRNRDTTGGVTNTQIGASKLWTLRATLDPGALPPGGYNLVFRVEDCTAGSISVSEFYTIEVFAAP